MKWAQKHTKMNMRWCYSLMKKEELWTGLTDGREIGLEKVNNVSSVFVARCIDLDGNSWKWTYWSWSIVPEEEKKYFCILLRASWVGFAIIAGRRTTAENDVGWYFSTVTPRLALKRLDKHSCHRRMVLPPCSSDLSPIMGFTGDSEAGYL